MAQSCATLPFDRTYVAPSFSSLGDDESTYLHTLLSTARPDALLPSTLLALNKLDAVRRWNRSSTRALQETYTWQCTAWQADSSR